MSKPEWGAKRQCQSCGTKYYDFRKKEIKCPKCGTVFDTEAVTKARRRSAPAPKKEVRPAPVEAEAADLPGVEDTGDDDDDALIEDTDDLDEEEVEVAVEADDNEEGR